MSDKSKTLKPALPVQRAAIYVRMSTDPQVHSIQHQRDKLYEYAEARGIEIIAMYADAGKSGLRINGREGMKNLIEDVQTGTVTFDQILVYDVSRWGRFQDVDESAHYEFICRQAGIKVVYCEEPFADDGSAISSILKNIKRTMAAEYSRELSSKVFNAQSKFAALGFKQGGPAGYGLRRAVVGTDGQIGRLLEFGGRKGPTSERVIFVLGPVREVAVVKMVYRYYIEDHFGETRIAAILNAASIPGEHGRAWNFNTVRSLLTNEKYTGTLVYNRSSFKLHNKVAQNPTKDWIKKPFAFPAIIPAALFKKAAAERLYRMRHFPRSELLEMLRMIYSKHGRVSTGLIDQEPDVPHHSAFNNAFGSLMSAYALAGVPPTNKAQAAIATLKKLETIRNATVAAVEAAVARAGAICVKGPLKNSILLSGNLLVKIVVVRSCLFGGKGLMRWRIELAFRHEVNFVIAVRMDLSHKKIAGYLLLPVAQFPSQLVTIKEEQVEFIARYQHKTIEAMFGSEIP